MNIYTAAHCNTLQYTATHCNTTYHTRTQSPAYYTHTITLVVMVTQVTVFGVLEQVIVCVMYTCTLQHTATHCNTIQHTHTQSPAAHTHTITSSTHTHNQSNRSRLNRSRQSFTCHDLPMHSQPTVLIYVCTYIYMYIYTYVHTFI